MQKILNQRSLFLLLALLIGNIEVSYSETPKAEKARVKIEYENSKVYTVFSGHRYYIGIAQFSEDEVLLDPDENYVFYAHTTGCGYENEGMTVFRSDIYGRKSIPILSRCEILTPSRFLRFNMKIYLLIEQSNGGTVAKTSFWLYDVKAESFVLHAEGEITEELNGIFSYGYYGEDEKFVPVGEVTIKNLINGESPLRLLSRYRTQALTLRKNTKIVITDSKCFPQGSDQYGIILNAGTKVMIVGECPDGGYEIYYGGMRGKVIKGSLKLLR